MKSKQNIHKNLSLPFNRRALTLLVIAIVLVLATVTGIFLFTQSERSIARFCRVAKEQKTILTEDANYEQRLDAYKKLEVVSPDEIRPDITTIRKGYESIVQDPSSALSTGFGMAGAENRRSDYITQNCTDF